MIQKNAIKYLLVLNIFLNSNSGFAFCEKSSSAGGTAFTKTKNEAESDKLAELLKKTRTKEELRSIHQLENTTDALVNILSQWNNKLNYTETKKWMMESVDKVGVSKSLMLTAIQMYQAFYLSGFENEARKLGPILFTLNPTLGLSLEKSQGLLISRAIQLNLDFINFKQSHILNNNKNIHVNPLEITNPNDYFTNFVFGSGSLFEKNLDNKIENRKMPFRNIKNEMVGMGGFDMMCDAGCIKKSGYEIAKTSSFFFVTASTYTKDPKSLIGAALAGAIFGVITEGPELKECVEKCSDTWGDAKDSKTKEIERLNNENERLSEENARMAQERERQKANEESVEKQKQEEKRKREKEEADAKQKEEKEKEEKRKKEQDEKNDKDKNIQFDHSKSETLSDCGNCGQGFDDNSDTMIATPREDFENSDIIIGNIRELIAQSKEWFTNRDPNRDLVRYEGDQFTLRELKKLMFQVPVNDIINASNDYDQACIQSTERNMFVNHGEGGNFVIPKDFQVPNFNLNNPIFPPPVERNNH